MVWLVGLPVGPAKRKEAAWELLQEHTAQMSANSKFDIPELRVGTLDTLMALSDDLSKSSNLAEQVVNKIKRQVVETGGAGSLAGLKVEGLAPDNYLTRYKWDEAKFPTRRPLRETVDKILEILGRIEDDLKVKVSEYNALKTQLNALLRKQTGSLSVRDISTLVKAEHVTDSENLTTLFVVVSKYSLQEWQEAYEKLTNFVVPRSSSLIIEDNDYALVNVVLFRRVADEFKVASRSKGYQVRDYTPVSAAGDVSAAQLETLKREVDGKRATLETWAKTAYGEAFSGWIHLAAIRVFVESILRYGLPPLFQAAVVRPGHKSEAKLRQVLKGVFTDGRKGMWEDDGSNVGAGLMGTDEMFPYVSLTLDMSDGQ
eukprot:CAMPEP_0119101894 /NCGR_PEP_ID=MMETSP1180-20130426/806_1 /TAXON_ID=3052 ORGANISM="Chlamydomonas cf sp, Strain CCMP681" /NCGR_SAMPLE_ID=MMETSP1180 /ASSEMBLY_ACC=CAM_ASM_000741 /LENGTH=371 /DNA_ID=CAMNT_0007086075 /DNA_START=51 /DNA_END=1166 /DNA_ORIENTATION=-